MTYLLEIGLTNAVLSAILAILVLAITRIWRNPHLANALWLIVLLKMVTPPIVSVPMAMGFRWSGGEIAPASSTAMDSLLSTSSSLDGHGSNPTVNPVDGVPNGLALSSVSSLKEGPLSSADTTTSSAVRISTLWPIGVGGIWLVGSAACFLVACVRIVRFHRLVKEADIANDHVQRIGKFVARGLGLKQCPKLRTTAGRISPMVWPIGSPPTVVLPNGLLEQLGEDQLQTIVAHEFGHIARRDCWVRWLELLCTILYWWNPCLWVARREIRVAEELCCDALVLASHPGCSHPFGVSLLKVADFLAGISPASSCLVSEMQGGGQLRKRIEVIVKGETAPRLSRTAKGVLLLVAFGILPVYAQEKQGVQQIDKHPAAVGKDAKAATLADIIKGLRASERSAQSLAVSCQEVSTYNFVEPGSKPPEKGMIEDDAVSMTRSGDVAWEAMQDGRVRMTAKYTKTNTRLDGSNNVKQEEFVSTFDGSTGQILNIVKSPTGVVTQRSQHITERFLGTGPSPYDFTTHQLGKPISTLVSEKGSKIIGIETWDKRPVVVVETPPVTVRDDYIYKQQFWIDTGRGYIVVRRQSFVQRGEGKPWGLHYQIDTLKHTNVSPGIWLPQTVDIWNYDVTALGQGHLVGRDHIEASGWSVNTVKDTSRFTLKPESINQIGKPIVATVDSEKNGKMPVPPKDSAHPENATPGFRKMLVKTVDDQGKVVPKVGIFVGIWPEGPYKKSQLNYTTDEKGQATVLVPDPPRLFRMWTRKAGYVPLFAQWWPKRQPDGHLVPEEYTFALPSGTEIGGVIVSDDGKPIEGATVEVALGNQIDQMGRRPIPSTWLSEASEPGSNPCITDAKGHWQLGNVPAGDEIFVRIKVSHPDYVSDIEWGEMQEKQSIPMKAFRDKSATITMQPKAKLNKQDRKAPE